MFITKINSFPRCNNIGNNDDANESILKQR